MKNAHEFSIERLGKQVDVDGAFGAQCWDLFAYFCKIAGYPVINCTLSGYVKDIANQRANNGILNNFVEVAINAMQDGDWVVWGECNAAPLSHIAMFRKDNGNGTGVFLGQNQGGTMSATQINMPYFGIIGVFRPKCYIATSQPTPANLKVGDMVQPLRNRSYEGVGLDASVLLKSYPIVEIVRDRVVLGAGLNTAFKIADLSLVQAPQSGNLKVPSSLPIGTRFYISELATCYGGEAYGLKIPDFVLNATALYTSGGEMNQHGFKWVLAKEIMSWVKVQDCLI